MVRKEVILLGVVIIVVCYEMSVFYTSYLASNLISTNLNNEITREVYSDNRPTRGIIICLFDQVLPIGVSLIKELRRFGIEEKIQVYHCLGELSPAAQAILTNETSVEIIDVCKFYVDKGVWNSWTASYYKSFFIKPIALLHSSFDEVMLIDADCIFLRSPAVLWDVQGYIDTGTLFFNDRYTVGNNYLNKILLPRNFQLILFDVPQKKTP